MAPPLRSILQEKEALLIMFGATWQQKFWSLDGRQGRPSIEDCLDLALRRINKKAQEDLIDYVEDYLAAMARRCEKSAQNSG